MNATERFWQRIDRSGGPDACWPFTGCLNPQGYGVVRFEGQARLTHRVAYILAVGPIPDGLSLDHLCRTHNCSNPAHLEPVTQAENTRRSPLMKFNGGRRKGDAPCPSGHPASEMGYRANGKRYCRACGRIRARAWTAVHQANKEMAHAN